MSKNMKTILYILFGGAVLWVVLWGARVVQNRIDVKYDACHYQWYLDIQQLPLSSETFPEKQINCMKEMKITNTK